jgi:hypothetical protein
MITWLTASGTLTTLVLCDPAPEVPVPEASLKYRSAVSNHFILNTTGIEK